ncbi:hypothetical protein F5Y00DRAFT_237531 [Daldinia vernicosa]|uniref:uncharacterized protein n=1 Tax=Daldinia vernicosa TaxID=114800 RepID=UPI002007EA6A|nr:uncharacterized protein F5Y00DRAFT_237531 [Daldinia vernicosa]KAI0848757.1 hypothetical protein F5Y00DRAFT_237531 [Daldinia vernicosa]
MYSLGIIPVETALWKPIEMILKIEDLATMKPTDLRNVRGKLLDLPDNHAEESKTALVSKNSEHLVEVGRTFGDSYRDIVEICLCANEVERRTYCQD